MTPVVLAHGLAMGQSSIRRPIGTGDCTPHVGGDYNDSSAAVWVTGVPVNSNEGLVFVPDPPSRVRIW